MINSILRFIQASGRVYGIGSDAKKLIGTDYHSFTLISLPAPMKCIIAGPFYSIFCSIADEVYFIGKSPWGQLGKDSREEFSIPTKSSKFSNHKIIQMKGYLSTACKTGNTQSL